MKNTLVFPFQPSILHIGIPDYYNQCMIEHVLQGVWMGMIIGIAVQTAILAVMTCSTDWDNQVDGYKDCVRCFYIFLLLLSMYTNIIRKKSRLLIRFLNKKIVNDLTDQNLNIFY